MTGLAGVGEKTAKHKFFHDNLSHVHIVHMVVGVIFVASSSILQSVA